MNNNNVPQHRVKIIACSRLLGNSCGISTGSVNINYFRCLSHATILTHKRCASAKKNQ